METIRETGVRRWFGLALLYAVMPAIQRLPYEGHVDGP
jgi:hypothetical protein